MKSASQELLEKIQSGYPRFILHPYLKKLAKYIEQKYAVPSTHEVVLISSTKAVKLISDRYFIYNKIAFDEPFGVILVQKDTSQLQKVLTYIQHVGCNLSSRVAEEYLYDVGLIESMHQEERHEASSAKQTILQTLSEGLRAT